MRGRGRGARGESERPGGVRGVADGVQGDERKQEVARGKQEVAEAASAPVGHVRCLLARGRRQEKVGWAALVGELGRLVAARVRPGRLCSFYFCSVFLLINSFATV